MMPPAFRAIVNQNGWNPLSTQVSHVPEGCRVIRENKGPHQHGRLNGCANEILPEEPRERNGLRLPPILQMRLPFQPDRAFLDIFHQPKDKKTWNNSDPRTSRASQDPGLPLKMGYTYRKTSDATITRP